MLEQRRHHVSMPPGSVKPDPAKGTSAMMKLWLALVPDPEKITTNERQQALAEASRSPLQSGEMKTLVAWLLIVFVGIPLLLLLYVPLHIRRIRRDIRPQLKP